VTGVQQSPGILHEPGLEYVSFPPSLFFSLICGVCIASKLCTVDGLFVTNSKANSF